MSPTLLLNAPADCDKHLEQVPYAKIISATFTKIAGEPILRAHFHFCLTDARSNIQMHKYKTVNTVFF